MRIHHLDCGSLCPVSARLVNGRGGLFARGNLVCHCLLTRGHCGVAVRDGEGFQLHAGDAYFHRGELEVPMRCPPGVAMFQRLIAHDDKARRQNRARLRTLAREQAGSVRIFSAHDPDELASAQAPG